MPYIQYQERRPPFNDKDQVTVDRADAICRAYAKAKYSLTLRQLYYQFVAQDLFHDDQKWRWTGTRWAKDLEKGTKNAEPNYNYLKRVISEARLDGQIDWDHIVDRTRRWEYLAHWGDPTQEGDESAKEFIGAVLPQFRTLKWKTQPYYIEVWVEKEALVDVVARPARRHDLSYFAARGYASQPSQYEAAQRFVEAIEEGKQAMILHLGDHDPSGIDMTRDIITRINLMVEHHTGEQVEVDRLALNMDQVRRYNPPPNPAKLTDSRVGDYIRRFGESSWELDALDPPTIDALITSAVEAVRDDEAWAEAEKREQVGKDLLTGAVERWDDVVDFLAGE